MRNSSTEPEIVMRNGKAVAVILDIEDYHELLEKVEDVESLRLLETMRQGPLEFRRLEDFLSEHSVDV